MGGTPKRAHAKKRETERERNQNDHTRKVGGETKEGNTERESMLGRNRTMSDDDVKDARCVSD